MTRSNYGMGRSEQCKGCRTRDQEIRRLKSRTPPAAERGEDWKQRIRKAGHGFILFTETDYDGDGHPFEATVRRNYPPPSSSGYRDAVLAELSLPTPPAAERGEVRARCDVCGDGKRLSPGWKCDVCGRLNAVSPLPTAPDLLAELLDAGREVVMNCEGGDSEREEMLRRLARAFDAYDTHKPPSPPAAERGEVGRPVSRKAHGERLLSELGGAVDTIQENRKPPTAPDLLAVVREKVAEIIGISQTADPHNLKKWREKAFDLLELCDTLSPVRVVDGVAQTIHVSVMGNVIGCDVFWEGQGPEHMKPGTPVKVLIPIKEVEGG